METMLVCTKRKSMLNLSTHQLSIFLTAAETLNFTHAARQLQMTQPSVSQNIQALEKLLGVQLFNRLGRAIEVTEAGLALIPMARDMLYLSAHIEEMMASLDGSVCGHLIVGCSTATGRYLLPKFLADFHRQYPHVRATCLVASQAQVLQKLSEGTIHLALATEPPVCQDIEFRLVTDEHLVLIAAPDHPWTLRQEIGLQDLLEADFILPEEGLETHTAVRAVLAQLGISIFQLHTLVSLGSLEAIALTIQEGLGVGFVPELLVNRLVKDKVVQITVSGLDIRRNIYVGRNTRRRATTGQNAFWELICEKYVQ